MGSLILISLFLNREEPNFVVTIARRAIEENEFETSDPRAVSTNAEHLTGNFLFCIILLTLFNEPSSPPLFDRISEIVLAHDRLSDYLKQYVLSVVRCFEFTDFSDMRPIPMVLDVVSPDSDSLRTDLLGNLLVELSTPRSVIESVVSCLNVIKECDINQLPTDKLVHVVESSRVLPESIEDINPVLSSLVTLFYGVDETPS